MHFLAADGIIKAIVTKLTMLKIMQFQKKKLCYNNKGKNKKQKEAFGALYTLYNALVLII
jgi:hypothetical protein